MNHQKNQTRASWMQPSRRAVIAFIAIALSLSYFSPRLQADDPAVPAIKMIIDYGDGVQKHFAAIPFKKEMTVFDAVEAATKHPRGIRFEHRGSGETAFVMKIDDLKNEGRGKNWTYLVNDKKAEESCGVRKLAANDVVLWKFAEFRYNP